MTSFLISALENEVFRKFFISQQLRSNLAQGIQNWMLILIFGSKSGVGDDFGQYDKKLLFYVAFWPNVY